MRRFCTLFVLLFLTFSIYAKHRDANNAALLAKEFLGKMPVALKSLSTNEPLKLAYTAFSDKTQTPCFYVFNSGNDAGFVIVSADDRAAEILGYSNQGSFDENRIPDNFRKWLGFYRDELVHLETLPEDIIDKTTISASIKSTTSVSPLLGNTMWDQGDPYNALCPDLPENGGKAAVGCVATAMAQVMYYHQWPAQGTGSKVYNSETHNFFLAVDFSTTTYDWANMTPTYDESSTQAEKDAVALLSYHCGVSVEMDYDASSGAHTHNTGTALMNYFGYDKDINILHRDYYGSDEWNQLVKNELDAARPVIYSGQSSDGGHAFVCDGYTNDFFHINWGWSGSSNGYYLLSALTPGVQGIGGGGSDGFNRSQGIMVGVKKDDNISNPIYNLVIDSAPYANVPQTTRDGSFNVLVDGLWNMGINTFDKNMGIALFQNGQFVSTLFSEQFTLNSYRGYSKYDINNVTIPSTVANGDYKLFFVTQAADGAEWEIIRGNVGTPNYLKLTVTDSEIIFNSSENEYPSFTVNNLTVNPVSLYQNRIGELTCNITNNEYEYNSTVAFKFVSKTDPDVTYTTSEEQFNIGAGETKDLFYSEKITLAPGEYDVYLMYDAKNNTQYPAVLSEVSGFTSSVTVLAEPTESPNLSVIGTPSFDDNSNVPKTQASFNATIKNTGGYFDGEMIVFIFPTTGGSSLTYIGYGNVSIDKNQELQKSFIGDINLPEDDYFAALFYYSTTESTFKQLSSNVRFTLKDIVTSVSQNDIDECRIYPNPASSHLIISTPEIIEEITIYNMMGKQVASLKVNEPETTIQLDGYALGTYLIRIKTADKAYIKKFVKK